MRLRRASVQMGPDLLLRCQCANDFFRDLPEPPLPVRPRSSGITDLSHGGARCGFVARLFASRLRLLVVGIWINAGKGKAAYT